MLRWVRIFFSLSTNRRRVAWNPGLEWCGMDTHVPLSHCMITRTKLITIFARVPVARTATQRTSCTVLNLYLFFVWEPVWEPGIWFQFGFGLDLGLPGDSVLWIKTPPHLPISACVPSMFRAHEFSPSVWLVQLFSSISTKFIAVQYSTVRHCFSAAVPVL